MTLEEEVKRRVMACVNACAGTSTEALEEVYAAGQSFASLARSAEKWVEQRDMLLAAIQQTLDENGHLADGENCTLIVLKRAIGEP